MWLFIIKKEKQYFITYLHMNIYLDLVKQNICPNMQNVQT